MKRWWISWNEPMDESQDCRPLSLPLPEPVKKWWISGEAADGSYATLCAVVDAENREQAEQAIGLAWKPSEWRFCEEKDLQWRPNDRFPWK